MSLSMFSAGRRMLKVFLPLLVLVLLASAYPLTVKATSAADGAVWTRITFYDCVPDGFCGHTFSGVQVAEGQAACDRSRLGLRFTITGDPTGRTYICTDTGSMVKGDHVDVFFYAAQDGWRWQGAVGSYAWVTWLTPGGASNTGNAASNETVSIASDDTSASEAAVAEAPVVELSSSTAALELDTSAEAAVMHSELPAPSGLKTRFLSSPIRVLLTWQLADSSVQNYNVYRDSSGSYELIGTSQTGSFEDKAVVAGATYHYYVTAVDSLGLETQPSPTLEVLLRSVLPAPMGLQTYTLTEPTRVLLTWRPLATDIQQYRVYRAAGSESYEMIGISTAKTFDDRTAVAGATYRYYVTAVDSLGLETRAGDEVTIRVTDSSSTNR